MASTSSATLSITSSSTFLDAKTARQSAAASRSCVSLPTLPLPPVQSLNRLSKVTASCQKVARNVKSLATGEAPAEVAATELPDFVKTVQETWDKVEDKYAVSSLAVAGVVALYGSTGLISAIDRLPLVPSVLEIVGIGFSGWFAYKNLVYKPDREALLKKVKDTYSEIIGTS